MKKNIVVISDFFINGQFVGGAELHDDVICSFLESKKVLQEKKKSDQVTVEYLKNNQNSVFFISNFVNLSFKSLLFLVKNCEYVIYEHDYKFLKKRNPIFYKDFKAPRAEIVNFNFYKNAKKVICLSELQKNIFEKNLNLDNIVKVNCSMWTDNDLELMSEYTKIEKKNGVYAVIDSDNPIKKTSNAIKFCKKNDLKYELIRSKNYREFLKMLSQYEGLVFMTGHPEPTPRVAIESKCLGLKFVSQKRLIGVAYEDYFHLNGEELIEKVKNLRDKNLTKIFDWCYE